jgi:hypothetical protein
MIENATPISTNPHTWIGLKMDEREFEKYANNSKCEIFKSVGRHEYEEKVTYFIRKDNQWFGTQLFLVRSLTPTEIKRAKEIDREAHKVLYP